MARPRRGLGVAVAQESDDDWITTGQAAKVGGVSRWKILRDAQAERLKSREIPTGGGKSPERRYRRRDVQEFYGLVPPPDPVAELRAVVERHDRQIAEQDQRLAELERDRMRREQKRPPAE